MALNLLMKLQSPALMTSGLCPALIGIHYEWLPLGHLWLDEWLFPFLSYVFNICVLNLPSRLSCIVHPEMECLSTCPSFYFFLHFPAIFSNMWQVLSLRFPFHCLFPLPCKEIGLNLPCHKGHSLHVEWCLESWGIPKNINLSNSVLKSAYWWMGNGLQWSLRWMIFCLA